MPVNRKRITLILMQSGNKFLLLPHDKGGINLGKYQIICAEFVGFNEFK